MSEIGKSVPASGRMGRTPCRPDFYKPFSGKPLFARAGGNLTASVMRESDARAGRGTQGFPEMTAATLKVSTGREPMQPRILIADDQQDVLDALRLLLKGHGYSIETVNSPADLLAAVGRQEFDILLIDLNYARDTNSCRAKFLKCRDMKSPARGNRRGWSAAVILTFFRWTKKHWESASPTWLEKACPPRS